MFRLPGAFDFDFLRRSWEGLARQDPLWAVLTDPQMRGGGWDQEAFFASGRDDIDTALAWVRAHAPELATDRALDFGCGAGRLTQALAMHFDHVVGVDIAPSMLAAAREFDATARCEWALAERPELPQLQSRTFDLVYSSLVLQHMPPALAKSCLAELCRLTKGVLAFQIPHAPSHGLRASRSRLLRALGELRAGARHRLARLARRPRMEMHAVPRAEVEAVLTAGGLELLAVEKDDKAGPSWISLRYCARRRSFSQKEPSLGSCASH